MSTKKNIIVNGAANLIQKLIRAGEQLVLVPFFISAWGVAYYGEWLTLTIIPSMLAFSDFGIGTAAANTFVLNYVSGDKVNAANAAKNGAAVICLTILLSVFLGAISLAVLDNQGIFDKTVINKHDALWAVSILMIARVINFFSQLFEGFYRAARKAALSTNLNSIYALVNIAVGLIVLILKGGIVYYSLANLACTFVFNLVYSIWAHRIIDLDIYEVGKVSKSMIKSIAKKGFGFLLSPIWQAIYFQGTTFIVRMILGPEAVALFSTVRTISRSANQAFTMINSSVFPELQFELASGNGERARMIYRGALGIVAIIATVSIFTLSTLGLWVYNKWTQGNLTPSLTMWNIFLIGIVLNALWWTAGSIFRAVNKPYHLNVAGVLSSLISISITYVLCNSYGLEGAAIGSVAMDLIMAIYVLPTSCRLIGQSMRDLPFKTYSDIRSLVQNRLVHR